MNGIKMLASSRKMRVGASYFSMTSTAAFDILKVLMAGECRFASGNGIHKPTFVGFN